MKTSMVPTLSGRACTKHACVAVSYRQRADGRSHRLGSYAIPSLSITRRERTLAGTVNETSARESQSLKCVTAQRPARLPWQAPSPICCCQTPADLDTRRKGRLKPRGGQTDIADEVVRSRSVPRPTAQIHVCLKMRLDPQSTIASLSSRESTPGRIPSPWITIHTRKRLAVRLQPSPHVRRSVSKAADVFIISQAV